SSIVSLSLHDALPISLQFFASVPRITEKLRVLEEVGLGYLRLGQSATTLSGGEAQRMKLAAHLQPASRDVGRPSSSGEGNRLRRSEEHTSELQSRFDL